MWSEMLTYMYIFIKIQFSQHILIFSSKLAKQFILKIKLLCNSKKEIFEKRFLTELNNLSYVNTTFKYQPVATST